MDTYAKRNYNEWLHDNSIDEKTKTELQHIATNEDEIVDRFFKELEFGTGGIRGIMGVGSNRMNVYTVGKVTQALAQYLRQTTPSPSIAIAYDSRHYSFEFALEAALILAGNGVKVYLFKSLRPTPELSFTVRHLKASAGIVVTASHNPPQYNGYKIYTQNGGQITSDMVTLISAEIKKIASFACIQKISREKAELQQLLIWLDEEMDKAYLHAVTSVSQNKDMICKIGHHFRVLYTPLHGTGNKLVPLVLKQIGLEQVRVVTEQQLPDGHFPTVSSPNPEEQAAFAIALKQAETWSADIIIGTDPDADRLGVIIKDEHGVYSMLTGNQTGAIMLYYLLETMKNKGILPQNGAIIKTVVTSELGAALARCYGISVFNTLTGFKYIGELMTSFDRTKQHTFIFGYEESYGYLAGNYARDKDGIVSAMLICEAGAYYKAQGKTLINVLHQLYEQYGYYFEDLQTRTLEGVKGIAIMQAVINNWRHNPPPTIAGISITMVEDFSKGLYHLPKENMLKFHLENSSWFCLRPSGTEPKIKIYFAVKEVSKKEARIRLQQLSTYVMLRLDEYIAAQL